MKSRKRILICPLDWGLGHASRCIPIIKELIDFDFEIVIGADNGPLALLKREFPQLEFIEFPGYGIFYSKNGNMPLTMILSLPRVFGGIYREHTLLKSIIKNYKIDAVISDNRFGLWNSTVPTIFITHQVMVKCPKHLKFLEPVIHRINKFFIDKYDECWIPDLKGEENLSADLSHRYPLPRNAEFIGSLSRFDTNGLTINDSNNLEKSYDLMAIISGPEPQRSIFENIVIKQLERTSLKSIIVRGVPEKNEKTQLTENL
ncbi:glycosyltransferase, partial [bacterium AH-315-M05]|nr:glycosyltransferase [bacterium AH-315-M05]